MSSSNSLPWNAVRIAAGVLALPLLGFGLAALLPRLGDALHDPLAVFLLSGIPRSAVVVGTLLLAFALRVRAPAETPWIGTALTVGLLAGTVGLVPGFVLPLVLLPDNNLGPMIGILYAGPAGVLPGAGIAGWISYRSKCPMAD